MTIAGKNLTERLGLRPQYNNNCTCKIDMIMKILDCAFIPPEIIYIGNNVSFFHNVKNFFIKYDQ